MALVCEYYSGVWAIPVTHLQELGIRIMLVDLDNTLRIPGCPVLDDRAAEWLARVRAAGIIIVFLTNVVIPSGKRMRQLGNIITLYRPDDLIPAVLPHIKPLPRPFKDAFQAGEAIIGEHVRAGQVVMIGDQVTDMIGAWALGCYTIMVDRLSPEERWYTSWKRPLERLLPHKPPKTA